MEEPTKRGRGRPKKDETLERLVLFVPPPVTAKVAAEGKKWAVDGLVKLAKPPRARKPKGDE